MSGGPDEIEERAAEEPRVDLSILMPVYNERPTIERAIKRTLEVDYPVPDIELLIVDDASTDGTRELLTTTDWPASVRVLTHDRNRGKGAAVSTAAAAARGTYCAILDADLEYDPRDIGALLPPLLDGGSEAVFGYRGFRAQSAFSFWYVMGGKVVNLLANMLYNTYLADVTCCHKAMRADLLRSLDLRSGGFEVDAEIAARLLRRGISIFEVPVSYRARSRAEGKKLTTRDGFRIAWTLLRYRFG